MCVLRCNYDSTLWLEEMGLLISRLRGPLCQQPSHAKTPGNLFCRQKYLRKLRVSRASAPLRLVSDLITEILRGVKSSGEVVYEEGFSVGNGAPSQLKASAHTPSLPASLAHEINNPLEVLLNLLQLVEAEPHLTADGRRNVTLAREEIRRLAQIVRDNLDKNRATVRQDTYIQELLDEVLELYQSRFDSKGIAIRKHYRPGAHVSVYRQRLRQAFSNLLLNAVDALPVGGTIRLKVCPMHEWAGEARHGLRVTVADNGIGIAARDLSRIFQPFFSTKGDGGTGMGLSIVKNAVDDHSGVLRVRSSTRAGSSGSVFSMFLPAA